MLSRSTKRRIDEIYSRLPPPPPPLSELPIAQWVRESMEEEDPKRTSQGYDQDFFKWHDQLGSSLVSTLRSNILEAWGLNWLHDKLELDEDEVKRIQERVEAVVPPYIDRYWRQWQADKPRRDAAIIASAEFAASIGIRRDVFPNTDSPEEIRRRADAFEARPPQERLGRDGWIAYHRERADLAEKYASWPEEWEQYYASWLKGREPSVPPT